MIISSWTFGNWQNWAKLFLAWTFIRLYWFKKSVVPPIVRERHAKRAIIFATLRGGASENSLNRKLSKYQMKSDANSFEQRRASSFCRLAWKARRKSGVCKPLKMENWVIDFSPRGSISIPPSLSDKFYLIINNSLVCVCVCASVELE